MIRLYAAAMPGSPPATGVRRSLLLIAAALALAWPARGSPAPPSVAAGDDSPPARQSISVRSNRRPGKPTGSELTISWRNPADADAQPPKARRFTIVLPRGSRVDTTVPQRCEASDNELMTEGADACPRGSVVGHGELVTDSGPSPFPRYTENALTVFNGEGEQIVLAESDQPPTRVVGHTAIRGRTFVSPVPSFPPGVPPEQSLVAFKRLHLVLNRVVREGVSYARTPHSCPPSRRWRTVLKVAYVDGSRGRTVARSPCRRRR